MKNEAFDAIYETFEKNIRSVNALAEFDRVVLDVAVHALENVQERATADGINSYRLTVDKELAHLRQIRQHDSLRSSYAHIFNQCVVLLVSYFGSAMQDLFSACVAERLAGSPTRKLLEEELKLTVAELLELGSDLREQLADLLIRKGDISFQDMQSIARAFEMYCGYRPERNPDTDNINLGLACRHVIVHAGAVVGAKCLKQVKSAAARTLKPDLPEGKVQFSVGELKILGDSMLAYVTRMIAGLNGDALKVP